MPGLDFTQVQGLVDDGEHGGGWVILDHMIQNKMINMAVFVVRYYGGKHIGPLRFQAIQKATEMALKAMEQAKLAIRRPPTQEEFQQALRNLPKSNPVEDWGEDTDSQYTENEDAASQTSQG